MALFSRRKTTDTALFEDAPVNGIIKTYGDLLFDLCESVLWSPAYAQLAFRAIIKEIKTHRDDERYVDHERSWVLRIACNELREFSNRHARKVTASEQIEIDSAPAVALKLKNFDFYFHRLGYDEQVLLLLRDKYGIPFNEIASAMETPEASLKTRRQQALRTLEDWLWSPA
jgi:DNA-directed RNA polymerase specialized sigma24 family protein